MSLSRQAASLVAFWPTFAFLNFSRRALLQRDWFPEWRSAKESVVSEAQPLHLSETGTAYGCGTWDE